MQDSIKLSGKLEIIHKDALGAIKDKRTESNLVVATGLAFIASRMASGSATLMSHMAVGSSSVAVAANQTDLVSILGVREQLDSSTSLLNAATYKATFEAGEGTGVITEAGIFNSSTGGDMLCRTVFSAITKDSTDTIEITWTITLNAV